MHRNKFREQPNAMVVVEVSLIMFSFSPVAFSVPRNRDNSPRLIVKIFSYLWGMCVGEASLNT